MQSPFSGRPKHRARGISTPPPITRSLGTTLRIASRTLLPSTAMVSCFVLLVQNIAHSHSTLCRAASQQAPAFEHGERVIEAATDLSVTGGSSDFVDRLQLRPGRLTILILRLDLAPMHCEHKAPPP